ncbi:MAG: hypothetical protein ABSF98_18185 [Bryobacteraceae bacterium]|jgi:hypothetical protein
MRPLDVPEILILLGVVGGLAWAVHNWFHRRAHDPGKNVRSR